MEVMSADYGKEIIEGCQTDVTMPGNYFKSFNLLQLVIVEISCFFL